MKSCRNCFHSTHQHDRLVCKHLLGHAHHPDNGGEKGVCARLG
jgi:hypothetical protein